MEGSGRRERWIEAWVTILGTIALGGSVSAEEAEVREY